MTDPTAPASTTVQHAPDGVGYRLLELPDELVHSTEKWTVSSKDGLARLTAGTRTYAMRQKNTSNALVLLRSAGTTLTAVATVHETVELLEETEVPAAAAPKPKNKWHEKFGRTR